MRPATRGIACGALLLPLLAFAAGAAGRPESAQPPAAVVDTTAVEPSGRTIAVPGGGDLQAALESARPGDVVALEPGATYRGPIVLPRKSGAGWIVIRTGGDTDIPQAGTRVDPGHARAMAKLVATSGAVVKTAPGAHHYRLVGLEIRPGEAAFLHNLVEIGWAETSAEDLPHHVIVERCYLHGDPKKGGRRGIVLNGATVAVIDSYLADFKEVGADSQAIAGWNGPGPFKIANNYLEGAGENVMFGGVDPSVRDLVPSDIEIVKNHFAKPLAWRQGDPAYTGTPWTIKNLFELKNARRVRIEGNLFEHNWAQAQIGFAVVFTVRNQDGRAPWSVVEDVTFANNVVRGSTSGINILGRDNNNPSQPTRRIVIKNNLFAELGGPRWGGEGRLFQLLDGTTSVVIDHNTAMHVGTIITAEGPPHRDFVFTNNIVAHNTYGITGSGVGTGTQALDALFPGSVVKRNVIVGGSSGQYPRDNFVVGSWEKVKFEDLSRGRLRLIDDSPYRRASLDGKDIGVDDGALQAAVGPASGKRR
ncbi:MAG: hypothetical protein DME00_15040 [Candidatus Rokuibacteriota bacterium]|nr:MAG: hypothetical protein DME00_15040 [Candidatus Rokubacteria bacterium]